jgi:hypothetical protein
MNRDAYYFYPDLIGEIRKKLKPAARQKQLTNEPA